MDVPEKQQIDWAKRIMAGEHLEEEMQNAGVLPHADTPLETNVTLHVLVREDGYGTSDRKFTMLCGLSWRAHEMTGAHKYFYGSKSLWHDRVNCSGCRELIDKGWQGCQ